MKGKVWCAVAIIALMAGIALADDPWKDAAYEKWNAKDVDKILKSSPWGREVVTATKTAPSENRQKIPNSSVNKYDSPDETPSEWVQVVWWSAKTTRRAVARRAILGGAQFPPENVKAFADTPMEELMIVIWGNPKTLAALAKLEPADLKKVAYLDSPRLKAHIEPVEAGAERQGNAPPDKIYFKFPRKLNGADTVTAEDGRIVFKWRLVRSAKEKIEDAKMFEVPFSPNKMISGGAADY